MLDFGTFRQSTESLGSIITDAQRYELSRMDDKKWGAIENIFKGIRVMASGTRLVGNSKAMHHLIPNVVPPIDREYTLRYLKGNKTIKNDLIYEWELAKEIIAEFFTKIVSDSRFIQAANSWMDRKEDYPWDTSHIKIVDNLITRFKKIFEKHLIP